MSRLNIPIVAITGTNGKSTVTKLLNRIYLEAGYRVGMCCTDFAMRNGTVLCKGDKAGPSSLWRLTMPPRPDMIVAETARGGILKYGLGFRECQVGVVTNIYEDHLGQDGVYTVEKMAEVKSVVPQHTASSGTLVLNADDSLVRKMAAKTRANIVYFTMDGLPDKDQFDNLFYLRDEAIWKRINGTAERVVSVNDITITRSGMLRYNIANTMAALAVVEAMKDAFPVSHEALHASLTAFGM
ncbi:MAG: cyanophycin synthetase, partial [Gammaproteobacteria bacterium]|nr:cyanophycin synthetase [Gammaproteobacteria bacterium]